jgi:hypothetical protein
MSLTTLNKRKRERQTEDLKKKRKKTSGNDGVALPQNDEGGTRLSSAGKQVRGRKKEVRGRGRLGIFFISFRFSVGWGVYPRF